ncbi:HD domain-containing protein [Sneathiella sp. CAU 1612]|uniref:HD domain-containing protein n=1 Tax=Sneathiella sedimenti TaxID=2816034 RepID=A0ABS3F6E1_9PROT|nr:HD domain-containing protein [Sneathiella sedimenti]MBO0334095.1 HD domain-containing protein [Sneathiella sedimenti]
MNDISNERARFSQMEEGTAADYKIISDNFKVFSKELPDRVLSHLKLLEGDFGGFAVDRLEHSLQSATLAHQDGQDEEYVVAALLHDIGDTLGTFNHADIGAAMLKPFVSDKIHWILEKHGIFQGYYFFHHIGLDRDMREQFRGHEHFEDCAHFCAAYDQAAFDKNFDSAPLEFFEPMVRRVMAAPKKSIYLME